MKLTCPLSGISYHTDLGYGKGAAPHPIFYLPLKSLVSQHLNAFCDGKLSREELHLFGAALLHKLPTVWEEPLDVARCAHIWKSHIEKLAAVCLRLDDRERDQLPEYHVCKETSSLYNLGTYLESISDVVAELNGVGTYKNTYLQRNAEEIIVRMLRQTINKAEKKHTLPKLLADWAMEVGEFPTYNVPVLQNDGITTKKQPLCQFWHHIIMRAFEVRDPVDMLSTQITAGDIDELIEHCEHNIEVGTVHSNVLLGRLRTIREVLDEFRSPATVRKIQIAERNNDLVSALMGDTEELTSVRVEVSSAPAPTSEPLRRDYPSMGAYLAAKIKWQRSN